MSAVGEPVPIGRFSGPFAYLSNFWTCPVQMEDGITYPSAEHAYQAQKSGDVRDRMTISGLATPGEAKMYGRRITSLAGGSVEAWDSVKKCAMLQVVLAKFWQHYDLATLLRETGAAELVEGNHWHDNYWGNCLCPRCPQPGENYLGQILMAVRMVLA